MGKKITLSIVVAGLLVFGSILFAVVVAPAIAGSAGYSSGNTPAAGEEDGTDDDRDDDTINREEVRSRRESAPRAGSEHRDDENEGLKERSSADRNDERSEYQSAGGGSDDAYEARENEE